MKQEKGCRSENEEDEGGEDDGDEGDADGISDLKG